MKLCKDCKNRGKKKNCQFYGITSNYAERCKDFEEICPEKELEDCRWCQLHSVFEDYRQKVYKMQEESKVEE